VAAEHFFPTDLRRTFTYCKPLLLEPGRPPRELNRLDSKNWTPTPPAVEDRVIAALRTVVAKVDALIVLDQVDVPETGVITRRVLTALREAMAAHPRLLVIADSRRGLRGFPPLIFKMNASELAALTGTAPATDRAALAATARTLARENGRAVFVTLAERGMLGALPDGTVDWVPALPVRGPIDVVGAGDAVTANLAAALAAGAELREALELASAAASIVLHQIGTTGAASVAQLRDVAG
jgi:bifunctional ADP-heptose synthase (sugar kinase/adenylyltransferase)